MPREKKITYKLKPYTRVTCDTRSRFKFFHPEDRTNLTRINRTSIDYANYLGLDNSLENFIQNKAKEAGRKLKILDSGCGAAVVIDWLLSNEELESSIESITGASLHYFVNIKQVMKRHGERFKYYLGPVQTVLEKASKKDTFDLIFDVWGAYAYCEDKLNLLKLYHQALAPGGQAQVYSGDDILYIRNERGEIIRFSEWAVGHYPKIFELKLNPHCRLIMSLNKTKEALLLPEHIIESRSVKQTIYTDVPFSIEQLVQGNAVQFTDVIATPISSLSLCPK